LIEKRDGWTAEIAEARGQKSPVTQLKVDYVTGFFLKCFNDLSSCRTSAGMGVGTIPWSAVYEYAQYKGISEKSYFEYFWKIIRACDSAFLEYANQQIEKQKK
jgi:hypothetical protein